MSPFVEVAIFPLIRNVNFESVPKSQRSRVIDVGLNTFGENLRVLSLCGGAGMFKSVTKTIINGMEGFRMLEKFTLKHDCTAGVNSYLYILALLIYCY